MHTSIQGKVSTLSGGYLLTPKTSCMFSSCSPTIVPLYHSLTCCLTYQPPLPTPTSQSHQNTEKIKSKLMSFPFSQSSRYSTLFCPLDPGRLWISHSGVVLWAKHKPKAWLKRRCHAAMEVWIAGALYRTHSDSPLSSIQSTTIWHLMKKRTNQLLPAEVPS